MFARSRAAAQISRARYDPDTAGHNDAEMFDPTGGEITHGLMADSMRSINCTLDPEQWVDEYRVSECAFSTMAFTQWRVSPKQVNRPGSG